MYLQFPTSQVPKKAPTSPKKAQKSPEKATSKDEILVKRKKQLWSFTSKIKMSKNRAVISYVMKENLLRKIQKWNKTKQQKVNFLSFFGEIEMIFFPKNFINFIESFTKIQP